MTFRHTIALLALIPVSITASAQFRSAASTPNNDATSWLAPAQPELVLRADSAKPEEKKKHWYEIINLRGYTQIRYNRLLETNEKLKCDQCDKSWGDKNAFFIRRARLIFSGNVGDHLFIYIQPDLASSPSSTALHFAQIRDAYFDVSIDKKKEFRFRVGQSKIPFGFENLQSSQNRLPLDRADALNSALPNERDLGVMFYWAPEKIRARFKSLVDDGLKGSGDYGVFGFGAFNGQTANKPEANNNLHGVVRLSYPFAIGSQIIEPGAQAYTGYYVMGSDQLSSGTKTHVDKNYLDQRVAGTLVVYPKPFGVLAEYNVGVGPEYNPATDSVEVQPLKGGAVTLSYMIKLNKVKQTLIPFARGQYYEGGKKAELDARGYIVKEYEIGIEYQIFKYMEFVAMYTISDRTTIDKANENNAQKGNLLRLQMQFNF